MDIKLWYNKDVEQWRWTLSDPDDQSTLESGNSRDLRTAMEDVAKTVEWMLEVPRKSEALDREILRSQDHRMGFDTESK